jgi:hypothetical protein
MTSSARGGMGKSFGFINRQVVAARSAQPHMTVFGGEDRLARAGRAVRALFSAGSSLRLRALASAGAARLGRVERHRAERVVGALLQNMVLKNTSAPSFASTSIGGSTCYLRQSWRTTSEGCQGAASVGYESENTITNTGTVAWLKQTGLPRCGSSGCSDHLRPPRWSYHSKRVGKSPRQDRERRHRQIPSERPESKRMCCCSPATEKARQDRHPAPRALPIAGSTTRQTASSPRPVHAAKVGAYVNSMWRAKSTLRRRRRQQLQDSPRAPNPAGPATSSKHRPPEPS